MVQVASEAEACATTRSEIANSDRISGQDKRCVVTQHALDPVPWGAAAAAASWARSNRAPPLTRLNLARGQSPRCIPLRVFQPSSRSAMSARSIGRVTRACRTPRTNCRQAGSLAAAPSRAAPAMILRRVPDCPSAARPGHGAHARRGPAAHAASMADSSEARRGIIRHHIFR